VSWQQAGNLLLWSGDVTVPEDFFGINYQTWPAGYLGTSAAPNIGYGIYRVHDHQGENGEWQVWGNQNPSQGVYDWTQLDNIIDPVAALGHPIWYTLMACPTWAAKPEHQGTPGLYGVDGSFSAPANMANLGTFVTQLVTRYRGKIRYLEIWNEPAYDGSSAFFVGTATEMAQMARVVYQAAKAVDPTIIITSPSDWSAGAYLVQFLNAPDGAGGYGRDWIDAVCVHPYYRWWHTDHVIDPDMEIRIYMHALRGRLVEGGLTYDYPIYVGETGYASDRNDPDLVASTPEELARWAVRYCIGLATIGARSAVLYCYDTTNAGDPLENPVVAIAWNNIHTALAGRRLRSVHVTPTGLYRIETGDGQAFEI
jgi:hypothetical protein